MCMRLNNWDKVEVHRAFSQFAPNTHKPVHVFLDTALIMCLSCRKITDLNKMNCELMITYDTPALRQTGSRNLTGPKTLPTIWGTYMKLVTKYQTSAINSC